MFKSGEFVAQYIEPQEGELDEEQIQPNGVDLRVDEILKADKLSVLEDDEYEMGKRAKAMQVSRESGKFWDLSAQSYVVVYDEIIEIPEDHVGFVYPRSRLLRCGLDLTSAVWDAGYRGRGEGMLQCGSPAKIEDNMRIGQIVMARSSDLQDTYEGHAQGERVE